MELLEISVFVIVLTFLLALNVFQPLLDHHGRQYSQALVNTFVDIHSHACILSFKCYCLTDGLEKETKLSSRKVRM